MHVDTDRPPPLPPDPVSGAELEGATLVAAPVVKPTIPKILHVIWIGPHDPPQDLINSWSSKHINGWFFMIWRDHQQGWANQAQIDRMREWNGKADLMRLEILWRHGGICVDADSECLRPLDEGPEDFLGNTTAFVFAENETCRPGILGCGVMGAPKNSVFFEECVQRAALADMSQPAWKTVGPLLVTSVAKDMPALVRTYPAKWVHPVHYSNVPAPGVDQIKPYASQKWGGTRGYGSLRKFPCRCRECQVSMLRAPWG